jgi:hypothetical protein
VRGLYCIVVLSLGVINSGWGMRGGRVVGITREILLEIVDRNGKCSLLYF